jgi:hypothetical protein
LAIPRMGSTRPGRPRVAGVVLARRRSLCGTSLVARVRRRDTDRAEALTTNLI